MALKPQAGWWFEAEKPASIPANAQLSAAERQVGHGKLLLLFAVPAEQARPTRYLSPLAQIQTCCLCPQAWLLAEKPAAIPANAQLSAAERQVGHGKLLLLFAVPAEQARPTRYLSPLAQIQTCCLCPQAWLLAEKPAAIPANAQLSAAERQVGHEKLLLLFAVPAEQLQAARYLSPLAQIQTCCLCPQAWLLAEKPAAIPANAQLSAAERQVGQELGQLVFLSGWKKNKKAALPQAPYKSAPIPAQVRRQGLV
ncbi:hypothetical protein GCAAIG_10845 [Candidatus Electronema halotolerans]